MEFKRSAFNPNRPYQPPMIPRPKNETPAEGYLRIIAKGKMAQADIERATYDQKKKERQEERDREMNRRIGAVKSVSQIVSQNRSDIDEQVTRLVDRLADYENQIGQAIVEDIAKKVFEKEKEIALAYKMQIQDVTRKQLIEDLEPVIIAELTAKYDEEVRCQMKADFEEDPKIRFELQQQLQNEFNAEFIVRIITRHEDQIRDQLTSHVDPTVGAESLRDFACTMAKELELNRPSNSRERDESQLHDSNVEKSVHSTNSESSYPDIQHTETAGASLQSEAQSIASDRKESRTEYGRFDKAIGQQQEVNGDDESLHRLPETSENFNAGTTESCPRKRSIEDVISRTESLENPVIKKAKSIGNDDIDRDKLEDLENGKDHHAKSDQDVVSHSSNEFGTGMNPRALDSPHQDQSTEEHGSSTRDTKVFASMAEKAEGETDCNAGVDEDDESQSGSGGEEGLYQDEFNGAHKSFTCGTKRSASTAEEAEEEELFDTRDHKRARSESYTSQEVHGDDILDDKNEEGDDQKDTRSVLDSQVSLDEEDENYHYHDDEVDGNIQEDEHYHHYDDEGDEEDLSENGDYEQQSAMDSFPQDGQGAGMYADPTNTMFGLGSSVEGSDQEYNRTYTADYEEEEEESQDEEEVQRHASFAGVELLRTQQLQQKGHAKEDAIALDSDSEGSGAEGESTLVEEEVVFKTTTIKQEEEPLYPEL